MRLLCLSIMIMAQLTFHNISHAQKYGGQDAQGYILSKLSATDIVFAGTIHQQPAILELMADIIPHLHEKRVTHIALEIESDQQKHIDEFLDGSGKIDRINLHQAIDHPKYRNLFKVLKRLPPAARPKVVAIDLPRVNYGATTTRNEYMAFNLASIIDSHPRAKIFSILGSVHVFRKLQWEHLVGSGDDAIRAHLEQWRPHLNMFSMVHVVTPLDPGCDFGRRMSPIRGTVAFDLDHRFKGWRLGLTNCMALRPAEPYELVDGVIVH